MRLARRMRAERPRHGVSQLKIGVLAHLKREGPMSPGELAAAEHIQPQSLSRTLANLEQNGLITRQVDAGDRRRSTLA
ncbi:MAG: MarR family winged helix-turn-helix transcriptional regulator, partial [Solirubrobacteraceae bacterium]